MARSNRLFARAGFLEKCSNARKSLRAFTVLPLAAGVALISCTGPGNPSSSSRPAALTYSLSIPSMNPDSVFVSVEIDACIGSEIRLALPFIYADNPVDSFIAPLVTDIRVTDNASRQLVVDTAHAQVGPVLSPVLTLSGSAAFPITVSYRVALGSVYPDSADARLSLVYLDSLSGFMTGSHLFAVPWTPMLVDMWRTPLDITLSARFPAGVTTAGVPAAATGYRSAYELLQLQAALGVQQLIQGTGGNQPFALYSLQGASPPAGGVLACTATSIQLIFDDILPMYGRMSTGAYPVLFHWIHGGLEGTHSFITRSIESDTDTLLGMIFAHETLHHWLGIRCGDRDDPWWKEGTANYLGYAVAGRLGLVSKQRIYNAFIKTPALSADEESHWPSEEYVRTNQYTRSLYSLTYHKGAQINMLIDCEVRRASGNKLRLDELTAALCRRFDGDVFTRRQFVDHFNTYASVDISGILASYADSPALIPDSTLKNAFQKLDSLGAFGEGQYTKGLSKEAVVRNFRY